MDKIFPLSSCVLVLIHEAPASSILALSMLFSSVLCTCYAWQAILFLLTSQLVITKEKFNKRTEEIHFVSGLG